MKFIGHRISLPLLVLSGLVVGFAFARWFDRHPDQGTSTVASDGHDIGETNGRLYTCSMHPSFRSPDRDARCPLCGMSLIPVVSTDAADDSDTHLPRLTVSARTVALMQVQVQRAERRQLAMPIELSGLLERDETGLRTISAWVPGRIESLQVAFTGREVQAGEPMARIFSPRLIAAQEEFLHALRAEREVAESGSGVVLDVTRLTVAAARERLQLLGLSADQVSVLERRGVAEDLITLPAPVGGVVLERLVAVGDYVNIGDPLYRLADLSRIWAQLEAYEQDLPSLQVGQPVRLTAQSYPGELFTGTVAFIDPAVDVRKRTARVRVEVGNDDRRLKPGMFVRGLVASATPSPHDPVASDTALAIPATAPLLTGRRSVVYVQLRDTDRPTFEPRDVSLGPRAGDWYPVLEGLEEGELVVIHGAFKIDAELQIRGRASMMSPADSRMTPPGHHVSADPNSSAAGAREKTQVPEGVKAALGRVVTVQFGLVNALAADDPEQVRKEARIVAAALRSIADSAIPDKTARDRWEKLTHKMHSGLHDMVGAVELEVQRSGFEEFSDALTLALRSFGISGTGPVYRAVCPMVQGREGFWLQSNEEITNPYHGEGMLRCGWIAEVFTEDQLLRAGP